MIGFCPLASGSKGNCIYLGTKTTKILIDAGLSAKATALKLAALGVSLEEIDAIFVTHEHTDHIKGLSILSCGKGIPVFTNSDTAKAICENLNVHPHFKIFTTNEPFTCGDLEVLPFSIQHDAVDPVAFLIHIQGLKLGFCADLGIATTHVAAHLQGCDYLYVEANHEPSMVHASNRPPIYKERVLGKQGHLSNQQCAALVKSIYHPGLRHIHLAHLSSECNSQDLALETIRKAIADLGGTTEVSIAHQGEVSQPVPFHFPQESKGIQHLCGLETG